MALLNRLYVIPTPKTVQYLKELFAAAPLTFDFDNLRVDIITTSQGFVTKPDVVYKAYCGTMKPYYDSAVQRASLIIPLESSKLQARFTELDLEGVKPYWFPNYTPRLVMLNGMPPMHKHYRGFISSVSTALYNHREPLEFYSEFCVSEDLNQPTNFDFDIFHNIK